MTQTRSPFDRVRSRVPSGRPSAGGDGTAALVGRDAEGKRALFSSMGPDTGVPAVGSVTIDCSRCGESTVMSPLAAARAAFPSLLLSVGIGRGDRVSTLGMFRRQDGAFLRCPACGRGSWTRLTVRL